jgi:predicted transcriptional regulator of viral defense system
MTYFETQVAQLTAAKELINSDFIYKIEDFSKAGISSTMVQSMVNENVIDEVYPGVYLNSETVSNDLLVRQVILGRGVYSFETALFLHDLSDKYPYQVQMSFVKGYKLPKKLPEDYQNITVKQTDSELLSIGVEELPVEGSKYKLQVYSAERTLSDIVKRKNTVEQDIINMAYKRYLASKGKNINKLLRVAKKVGAEKQVSAILEVLL